MTEERGVIRRSQAITTFGVGALVDLPEHSAIIGGLDGWPDRTQEEIREPRLAALLTGINGGLPPRLLAPPTVPEFVRGRRRQVGVPAFRFPAWFVERQPRPPDVFEGGGPRQSRRLVPRSALDGSFRFEKHPVVATRFVAACPRGHLDDIDWYHFVHKGTSPCRGQLSLDERGTVGDLSELAARCQSCRSRRVVARARLPGVLGTCSGRRPWLGSNSRESCSEKARLLIRTATNAWFPQIASVLSLPRPPLEQAVEDHWEDLKLVAASGGPGMEPVAFLRFLKENKPHLANALEPFDDALVVAAILGRKPPDAEPAPPKVAELHALLAAPEGFGDDIPVHPDFHARRLPNRVWRRAGSSAAERVASVIQVHRLREVQALVGFTRFEAVTRGVDGEVATDVKRAALGLDTDWFPAVENRGEGVFLELDGAAVKAWQRRKAVRARVALLGEGQERWNSRSGRNDPFVGGATVMLHTLSHLLIHAVSLTCGYPAASIRERIYRDAENGRYGLLLYTASADSEGTLGGLVEQARRIADHLEAALDAARLCSNDPICAHHRPGQSLEERWRHGAACHGCVLVAETSCEMRNDDLDRALVAPVIGCEDAAFFR